MDTYRILHTDSITGLEAQVERAVAQGFVPVGGVQLVCHLSPHDWTTYYQAVYRAKPVEPRETPAVRLAKVVRSIVGRQQEGGAWWYESDGMFEDLKEADRLSKEILK